MIYFDSQTKTSSESVTFITEINDLEKIRSFWQASNRHPNTDLDLYKALFRSGNQYIRPMIIVTGPIRSPKGILVCRVEESLMEFRFGYKALWSSRTRSILVMYGGILGDRSRHTLELYVLALKIAAAREKTDLILFNHLDVDCELFKILKEGASLFDRKIFLPINVHRTLSLDVSFEDYFKGLGKKNRDNFRRYAKRLKSQFGEEVVVKRYEELEDIDRIFSDSEAIARITYQRGIGEGFVDDQLTRQRYSIALSHGWLNAYIMYIRNEPVAYCHVIKYKDILFASGRGYDPLYRKYSIGNLLQLRVTEDFCADPDVKSFDFGFGDSEYKRVFCDKAWNEASMQLYSFRLRGFGLYAVSAITLSVNHGATVLLKKSRFLSKVKRYWRSRVAPS